MKKVLLGLLSTVLMTVLKFQTVQKFAFILLSSGAGRRGVIIIIVRIFTRIVETLELATFLRQ